MPDHFDEVAETFGITRDSAIRTYCADSYAEMALSLRLICELLRKCSPDLAADLVRHLEMLRIENADLAQAAATVLGELRPADYQIPTD